MTIAVGFIVILLAVLLTLLSRPTPAVTTRVGFEFVQPKVMGVWEDWINPADPKGFLNWFIDPESGLSFSVKQYPTLPMVWLTSPEQITRFIELNTASKDIYITTN